MTASTTVPLTDADIAYIREHYLALEEVCARSNRDVGAVRRLIEQRKLPRPSYVLPDGTPMAPEDYFVLPDAAGDEEALADHFKRRYWEAVRAVEAQGEFADAPPIDWAESLGTDWAGYLDGVFGVCLRWVVPETIVAKHVRVVALEYMLGHPEPTNEQWQSRLRRRVKELDLLEREFSPDHDRVAFAEPPSRDRLIATSRLLYPAVFRGLSPPGAGRSCEVRRSALEGPYRSRASALPETQTSFSGHHGR